MTSPPNNYALSPPYPPHITIPSSSKKRSTDMMPTSAPSTKRRKHSMLSTTSSNHPLRQTSFPPPDDLDRGARYSPSSSIDDMSSLVSSNTKNGAKPKKSTGKRKRVDDDTASLVSGRGMLSVGKQGASRGSKGASRGPSTGADAEEEEDDGDDAEEMGLAVVTTQGNTSDDIKRRQYTIREAMDPLQQDRFDTWHRAKLNPAMVKKLVNQTLSQSVPENVVFAIRTAAKLFAGEIVERACKVQDQWVAASPETQMGKPKLLLGLPSPPADESGGSSQLPDSNDIPRKETEAEKELRESATFRGPLLPEHLNEAFRRYKEYDGPDREMLNVWRLPRSTGAERFGVKNRKGRLFGGGRTIG